MALELTLIESLPPPVERAAGAKTPAAMKMMAAKGLAPLKPAELATALYQLALDGDDAVKAAALKSAIETPEKILGAALAEALDARVLDFFARRCVSKPKLLETVLLNKATADETFKHLAGLVQEEQLEMIAKNEERLLRHPPIIAALYLNPKTRMSTVQRAVELAVRNGVKVEGIPAFEEATRAIAQSGPLDEAKAAEEDAAFKRAAEVAVDASAGLQMMAVDEEEALAQAEAEAAAAIAAVTGEVAPESVEEIEEKKKRLTDLSPAAQVRAATLGNAFTRALLIRSRNKQVAMACIKAPGVSEPEATHYALDRSLDEDVIRFIASRRQWLRNYNVKLALCQNPKCPLPTAMGFLPHLRAPELKSLARSKGIPSALANAAKQLLKTRGGDA
jgi:hypothetical protein